MFPPRGGGLSVERMKYPLACLLASFPLLAAGCGNVVVEGGGGSAATGGGGSTLTTGDGGTGGGGGSGGTGVAGSTGFGGSIGQGGGTGESYGMVVLPTDVPRFMIVKRTGTTCIRVRMVAYLSQPPEYEVIVTPEWAVENIVLTNLPEDCDFEMGSVPFEPAGDSVQASSAAGKVEVDMPDLPCGATADMKIAFPFTGWGPDVDGFQSPYLSSGLPCDL